MAATATPYGLRAVNLIGGIPFAGSTRQISMGQLYPLQLQVLLKS